MYVVSLVGRRLGRALVLGLQRPVAQPVHLHPGLVHPLALLGLHGEPDLELAAGQRVGTALGADDVRVDEPGDPLRRHLDGEGVPLVLAEAALHRRLVEVVGAGADVEVDLVVAHRELVERDVLLAAALARLGHRDQLGEHAVRRVLVAVLALPEPGLPAAVRAAGDRHLGGDAALVGGVEGEHAVLGADRARALDAPALVVERADERLVVDQASVAVPAEGVAGVDRAGRLAGAVAPLDGVGSAGLGRPLRRACRAPGRTASANSAAVPAARARRGRVGTGRTWGSNLANSRECGHVRGHTDGR